MTIIMRFTATNVCIQTEVNIAKIICNNCKYSSQRALKEAILMRVPQVTWQIRKCIFELNETNRAFKFTIKYLTTAYSEEISGEIRKLIKKTDMFPILKFILELNLHF